MARQAEASNPLDALIEGVVRVQLGRNTSRVEHLVGSLGTRSFARVWLAPETSDREDLPATLIARLDAPEDPARRPSGAAPEPPLEPIRSLLEHAGLPVPLRYGGDDSRGVELLEDLGTQSLREAAQKADREQLRAFYAEACALVPRFQRIAPSPGVDAFERRLDEAVFRHKAERFTRWSLGDAGPARVRVVDQAFARIAVEALRAPQRLAHRDLQSANLHVVAKGRVGPGGSDARLVVIDLQGALMAPPEYDLVCLLRDSYLELPDDLVTELLAGVRERLPDAPEAEIFAYRFDLLTITRKAKDHALFLYAAAELADSRYLGFIPATLRYLRAAATRVAAKDRAFESLAELIDEIPEPPCGQ